MSESIRSYENPAYDQCEPYCWLSGDDLKGKVATRDVNGDEVIH